MIYKIIFGLGVIFGIYQLFRTVDLFSLVILGSQIIGIASTFITTQPFKMMGSWVFLLSLVLAIVYALTKTDSKTSKRILIGFAAGLVLFIHFVPFYHRNDLRILGLGMVIPSVAYIIFLAKDYKSYKNELGFLTIIMLDGLSLFIESFQVLDIYLI